MIPRNMEYLFRVDWLIRLMITFAIFGKIKSAVKNDDGKLQTIRKYIFYGHQESD